MIIDGHAHLTRDHYGSLEVLREQMENAGIDKAVLVPGGMLDVRKMTRYITGEEKPTTTEPPNDRVEDAIQRYPDQFYGFYCVDPHRGEVVLRELEDAVGRGFSGLKLAPTVHQFSLTAPTVLKLAELCGDLRIPFYTHVVFSPGASTKKVGYLAKSFPKTRIILGHMGFGPADIDGVRLAKENDNLFLETSQGSFLIIKEALEVLGSAKLIFGSEFPLYHPLPALQNILALKCSDDEKENILGRNLLGLIDRKAIAG